MQAANVTSDHGEGARVITKYSTISFLPSRITTRRFVCRLCDSIVLRLLTSRVTHISLSMNEKEAFTLTFEGDVFSSIASTAQAICLYL
jgi:hypothetical protein